MYLPITTVATLLLALPALVYSQTPPGFTPSTTSRLEVTYGTKSITTPGTSFTKAGQLSPFFLPPSFVPSHQDTKKNFRNLQSPHNWHHNPPPPEQHIPLPPDRRGRPRQLPKPLGRPSPHEPACPDHRLQVLRDRQLQRDLSTDFLVDRSNHVYRPRSSGGEPAAPAQVCEPVVCAARGSED